MKKLVLSLTAVLTVLLAFGPELFASNLAVAGLANSSSSAVDTPVDAVPGGGSIKASGKAPGNDSSVEIKKNDFTHPGNITVLKVTVGGKVLKKGTDYTVQDDGTPSPQVTFVDTPPDGTEVIIKGTTSKKNPSGKPHHEGTLKW